MTLLIDSSVLFDLERDDKVILKRVKEISKAHPGQAFISFMTYTEFLYGIEGKPDEKKAKAKEFVWKFSIINTTNETALWLAYLKHKYDRL